LSDTLFSNIKNDYLAAYKWYAKTVGKSGIKVWKAKDNKAVGLLINYMKDYYLQKDGIELNSTGMRSACRVWLNKAFTTAPEWLKVSGELTLLVSRFDEINQCLDPKSQAAIVAKLKKDKSRGLKYNPKKHEMEPEFRTSKENTLSTIIKNIGNTE